MSNPRSREDSRVISNSVSESRMWTMKLVRLGLRMKEFSSYICAVTVVLDIRGSHRCRQRSLSQRKQRPKTVVGGCLISIFFFLSMFTDKTCKYTCIHVYNLDVVCGAWGFKIQENFMVEGGLCGCVCVVWFVWVWYGGGGGLGGCVGGQFGCVWSI